MISVLYLSNMMKDKGYNTVLELANQCYKDQITNIEFNFAGGWGTKEDEKYFMKYVADNKLDDIVRYNGLVHGNQKIKLFSQATLFVFPSQYKKEVFPLSLLEALSYGLPILTFNTGAISEIINDKIGVMSNKERIFDDFKRMIGNSQTENCYKTCREEYLNNYTVEVFEKNLLSTLTNN
nr:glycosyltransferase [Hanstruepera marina]